MVLVHCLLGSLNKTQLQDSSLPLPAGICDDGQHELERSGYISRTESSVCWAGAPGPSPLLATQGMV